MKQIIVISNLDLDYLFDNSHDSCLVTYIDNIDLLSSVLHIDMIDYYIIDTRMFKKNYQIYEMYEKLKIISDPSKIFLLIDSDKESLLWLTDYLIHAGFQNFLSAEDSRSFDDQMVDIDINHYKIDYEIVSGNRFTKRRIKKRNKKKEERLKSNFLGENRTLNKILDTIEICILLFSIFLIGIMILAIIVWIYLKCNIQMIQSTYTHSFDKALYINCIFPHF